ncbi:uncharacterized protein LOC128504430 [Spea bombifrons]|uniref:uncharacterized protein LOC128504430 n=1 Tax=Spea bombifrons TaxID=233779 RepID=UPI00234B2D9C|nr:uncharacterized protein LOC128504430 [Spea bombifrons]
MDKEHQDSTQDFLGVLSQLHLLDPILQDRMPQQDPLVLTLELLLVSPLQDPMPHTHLDLLDHTLELGNTHQHQMLPQVHIQVLLLVKTQLHQMPHMLQPPQVPIQEHQQDHTREHIQALIQQPQLVPILQHPILQALQCHIECHHPILTLLVVLAHLIQILLAPTLVVQTLHQVCLTQPHMVSQDLHLQHHGALDLGDRRAASIPQTQICHIQLLVRTPLLAKLLVLCHLYPGELYLQASGDLHHLLLFPELLDHIHQDHIPEVADVRCLLVELMCKVANLYSLFNQEILLEALKYPCKE